MVGPQKLKPSAFSSLDMRLRQVGFGRDVGRGWRSGSAAGVPSTWRQRQSEKPAPLLDALPGAGRGDGALDLAAVADDAGIGQQARDLGFAPAWR